MPYPNILEQFDGSVWAIRLEKLEEIRAFVESLSADKTTEMAEKYQSSFLDVLGDEEDDPQLSDEDRLLQSFGVTFERDGAIAIVPVRGTIMKRGNLLTRFSGGTSTEMLEKVAGVLRGRDSVSTVVLDVDSPGGSVGGLSSAAAALRSLRETEGKEVIAVANDMMASAAYWLGSAANKVYGTRNSMVGSIGVYRMVRDASQMLEDAGIKYHIIRSSPLKGAASGVEGLTEAAAVEMQRELDGHYDEFIEQVTMNRYPNSELTEKKNFVREHMADARVYVGSNAFNENFTDGTKSLSDVLTEIHTNMDNSEKQDSLLADANVEIKDLRAHVNQLHGEKTYLEDMVERLEMDIEDYTEELESNGKAAAGIVADQLIGEGRVAAASRETVVENLNADRERFEATYFSIPIGTYSPDEFEVADQKAKSALSDEELAANYEKEHGVRVALTDTQAEVLSDFGREFVHIDSLKQN